MQIGVQFEDEHVLTRTETFRISDGSRLDNQFVIVGCRWESRADWCGGRWKFLSA